MIDKDRLKKYSLIGLVVIVAIIFISKELISQKKEPNSFAAENIEMAMEEVEKEDQETVNEGEAIHLVDIKGAVKQPGLYSIEEGDRIQDVIQAAGGFTKKADTAKINLAARVYDEMVIYIPQIGEEIDENMIASNGTPNNEFNQSSVDQDDKININQADEEEIQQLNGIGPKKAEAIITYREENGPFQTVEDLLEVSGIGEKTVENIRDQLIIP